MVKQNWHLVLDGYTSITVAGSAIDSSFSPNSNFLYCFKEWNFCVLKSFRAGYSEVLLVIGYPG